MAERVRSENVKGGRPHVFQVKASDFEKAALELRAARAGKTVPRLLREAALAEGGAERIAVEAEVKEELAGIRNLMRALGNNMNQLARQANAGVGFPEEATFAVRSVQGAAARINEVLLRLERQ